MKLPPSSQIFEIHETDQRNFSRMVVSCGAEARLVDDIHELYRKYLAKMKNVAKVGGASAEMATGLYATCNKHLHLAAMALLRCYSSPAYRETRAAVEAVGLARFIRQSSDNYDLFANDDIDGEHFKKFRRATPSGVLFPEAIGLMWRLGGYYDQCSRFSHTNIHSFAKHLHDRSNDGHFLLDYQDTDHDRAKSQLVWTCWIHCEILAASEIVFDGLPHAFQELKADLIDVYQRVDRFRTPRVR